MKVLTLDLSDHLELDEVETKRFLAAKLYESGKLSLGHAAEMAGLSKGAFSEILSDFQVSLIHYPIEEVLKDADKF
jgi:predicted HTH domain antitoxin